MGPLNKAGIYRKIPNLSRAPSAERGEDYPDSTVKHLNELEQPLIRSEPLKNRALPPPRFDPRKSAERSQILTLMSLNLLGISSLVSDRLKSPTVHPRESASRASAR